jgi:prolyl-tRNA editing enzyme YbaK/EbsC (Cys-tRNA(Pro) deacylase)
MGHGIEALRIFPSPVGGGARSEPTAVPRAGRRSACEHAHARRRPPRRIGLRVVHPTAAKVQERLAARGLDVEVRELLESTRTAVEAASACGCKVGQIVKSLVFVLDARPTLVLCAGDRRVTALDGRAATADEARRATGFAIGGIPPLGHDSELPTIVDASLRRFDRVWCAAGTPHAVFETGLEELLAALPDAVVAPV